jgi:hypothetical protein
LRAALSGVRQALAPLCGFLLFELANSLNARIARDMGRERIALQRRNHRGTTAQVFRAKCVRRSSGAQFHVGVHFCEQVLGDRRVLHSEQVARLFC